MNNVKSEKYGISPEVIKKKLLSSERFRAIFNFYRIEKIKLAHDALNRYNNKKYKEKRKKLRESLNIGDKVLVLAQTIPKKNSSWKLLQAICTDHC